MAIKTIDELTEILEFGENDTLLINQYTGENTPPVLKKIKAGNVGGNTAAGAMVVTLTETTIDNETVYESDKTLPEIYDAWEAGNMIYVLDPVEGFRLPIVTIMPEGDSFQIISELTLELEFGYISTIGCFAMGSSLSDDVGPWFRQQITEQVLPQIGSGDTGKILVAGSSIWSTASMPSGFSPDITFNNVIVEIDTKKSGNLIVQNDGQNAISGTITLNSSLSDIYTKLANGRFVIADGRININDEEKDGKSSSHMGIMNTGFYIDSNTAAYFENEVSERRAFFCWADNTMIPELLSLFGIASLSNCLLLVTCDGDKAPLFVVIDCSNTSNITITGVYDFAV